MARDVSYAARRIRVLEHNLALNRSMGVYTIVNEDRDRIIEHPFILLERLGRRESFMYNVGEMRADFARFFSKREQLFTHHAVKG